MPQDNSPRQEFATRLAELVEQFDRQRADYLRPDYSEAQARLDFINPFFEALGWDIRNKAGLGSKEREVVVEQGETVGRPDYGFRLNGRTVFFAETKAPHVPLDRTDVIMQAKSYAWNSPDVFISAVTDFEELRLYDTTAKPDTASILMRA
jgi:predicted type IV restriction endonuclease